MCVFLGWVSFSMACWAAAEAGGLVAGGWAPRLAGESGQTAPSESKPLPPSGTSTIRFSFFSEKREPSLEESDDSSGAESQWLTDLLRQEFQRWLTSRSEALFNQLQAEFGEWLALRRTQQSRGSQEPDRPEWVDAPPGVIDGQFWQTVKAGPAPTLQECQEELRSEIQKAVAAYAEKRFGNPLAQRIGWNIDPLLPEILADQWQQTRLIDLGSGIGRKPMIWLYGRLRFNRPVQEEIDRQYRQAVIQNRLRTLAGISAGLVLLLGISYGILRWQCNRLYPPKSF